MPEQDDAQARGQVVTLGELGESGILREVFARLGPGREATSAEVGPGDDAAVHDISGPVIATTDAMVRGRDWLDQWSTGHDVGVKVVTQNLADISAMGGVPTGILVTLIAPGDLSVSWAMDFTEGLSQACQAAGVAVLGGDLSSSLGEVVVSVTALGVLTEHGTVLRSGAQAGDVLAVSGPLGRSAAGWDLLQRSDTGWWPPESEGATAADWVGFHCAPSVDFTQGSLAAKHGATSMLDVSDGLGRDARRIAEASQVDIDLEESAIQAMASRFAGVLGSQAALSHVLSGGEEHELLATFANAATVPSGWTVIGAVRSVQEVSDGDQRIPAVYWAGKPLENLGWDHFEGSTV